MIAASACLMGVLCRYDGGHRLDERVMKLSATEEFVALCPEDLGGLPIPRPTAEMVGGDGSDVLDGDARVVDAEGKDITDQFIKGANEFLSIVKKERIRRVVLKERSPSCGVDRIYNNGALVAGRGVLTALLMRAGIEVISNEEIRV